jgi:hypothetical protein
MYTTLSLMVQVYILNKILIKENGTQWMGLAPSLKQIPTFLPCPPL